MIITLDVNGLKTTNERQRFRIGFKSKIQLYTVYQKPTLTIEAKSGLKVKGWKILHHAETSQRVTQEDFGTKNTANDKKGHLKMINQLIKRT